VRNRALAFALALVAGASASSSSQPQVSANASRVHQRAIVIDTHDDTTQRLIFDKTFDIGARHADGSIDIPRVREGGLDAIFFSIWITGDVTGPTAVRRALRQIDAVREAVRTHPRDLVLATSAADIRRAAASGQIAALMGVEGGHMLDEDLGVLRSFAALGVRYLTLTHSLNTTWADSSGDTPVHNGLTAFGREVVRELNRLGVMVDLSHVADKTFYDALEVTRAPVLLSHSSMRAISKHPRNVTDDMLRALAKNGGVVMINYNAAFLSEEYRVAASAPEWRARFEAIAKACAEDEACAILGRQRAVHEAMRAGQLPRVEWHKVVEHIEHAVKIAGIDHVGLGSDFDGADMPLGLEDASKLPTLTNALLAKGYSEGDVHKILGGNVLRVMEQVEKVRH
jgi:membrane dipeptidase